MKRLFLASKCSIPEIADRKRRFFSHPVILRGLMPRSAVLSEAKECPLFCHPEAKPKGLFWRFFPFA